MLRGVLHLSPRHYVSPNPPGYQFLVLATFMNNIYLITNYDLQLLVVKVKST